MEELVPVILGVVLGALISRSTTGRNRIVLSAAVVLVSGAAATILSGEYVESWVYLLLDLGEASLGLALGFLIVFRLLPARAAQSARPPAPTEGRS